MEVAMKRRTGGGLPPTGHRGQKRGEGGGIFTLVLSTEGLLLRGFSARERG